MPLKAFLSPEALREGCAMTGLSFCPLMNECDELCTLHQLTLQCKACTLVHRSMCTHGVYTVHCAACTLHQLTSHTACTLFKFALFNVHWCSVHFGGVFSEHCSLCSVHCKEVKVHCIPCTLMHSLYSELVSIYRGLRGSR